MYTAAESQRGACTNQTVSITPATATPQIEARVAMRHAPSSPTNSTGVYEPAIST
jgi:hypothetical protein